ncbi:flagellar filament capping protein FliD [Paenibacillus sp. GYB006]|uniref:flagellar filament capping protein FliD n=1 Tax=Paenibacillus sp. GYB006 TaxID=2994394 RepID=UPI002F968444
MRISGLASGIDTDSMVKALMTAAKTPLNTLNQKKQIVEWQRESYREVNSKLVDFRNNKLSNYRLAQTMNTQTAVVSGNTNAVTAVAKNNANGISMNVVVERLATKSGIEGELKTSTGVANSKTTLGSLESGNSSSTYTIEINQQKFEFSGTDTIASVVSKINGNKDAKATAIFDEVTGRLSITSSEFGKGISVDSDSSNFMKLTHSTEVKGQKALVKINGVDKEYDSNTVEVNGVQLTFNGISKDSTGSINPTVITTEVNSSNVLDTVKAFIQQYNDLLSLLNSKTSEEKYRTFQPLTDDQKEAMSEDDIEKWTEKAKSGLLKNDDILKSTVSSMRSVITEYLGTGSSVSLGSLGITTGTYSEGGKLYLDEAKLKAAVLSNPEGVLQLFQGSAVDSSDKGLFDKMYDKLGDSLDKLATKAGTSKYSADVTAAFNTTNTMYKTLKDYDKRISAMTTKLNNLEERYYNQFTAMEKALSQLNNQSNSLANLFSSGS